MLALHNFGFQSMSLDEVLRNEFGLTTRIEQADCREVSEFGLEEDGACTTDCIALEIHF